MLRPEIEDESSSHFILPQRMENANTGPQCRPKQKQGISLGTFTPYPPESPSALLPDRLVDVGSRVAKKSTAGTKNTPISLVFEPRASM